MQSKCLFILAWVDAVRHWAVIWVASNAFTLLPIREGKWPLVLGPSKTAALQVNWCSDWNTPAALLPWAECSADYGLWTKEARPVWSTFPNDDGTIRKSCFWTTLELLLRLDLHDMPCALLTSPVLLFLQFPVLIRAYLQLYYIYIYIIYAQYLSLNSGVIGFLTIIFQFFCDKILKLGVRESLIFTLCLKTLQFCTFITNQSWLPRM